MSIPLPPHTSNDGFVASNVKDISELLLTLADETQRNINLVNNISDWNQVFRERNKQTIKEYLVLQNYSSFNLSEYKKKINKYKFTDKQIGRIIDAYTNDAPEILEKVHFIRSIIQTLSTLNVSQINRLNKAVQAVQKFNANIKDFKINVRNGVLHHPDINTSVDFSEKRKDPELQSLLEKVQPLVTNAQQQATEQALRTIYTLFESHDEVDDDTQTQTWDETDITPHNERDAIQTAMVNANLTIFDQNEESVVFPSSVTYKTSAGVDINHIPAEIPYTNPKDLIKELIVKYSPVPITLAVDTTQFARIQTERLDVWVPTIVGQTHNGEHVWGCYNAALNKVVIAKLGCSAAYPTVELEYANFAVLCDQAINQTILATAIIYYCLMTRIDTPTNEEVLQQLSSIINLIDDDV